MATGLTIFSADGQQLAGPLNFKLRPGQRVALVGQSGAGKTSLMNLLLGNLPYRGSLLVNGTELRDIALPHWQQQLAWVGQNPTFRPPLCDRIFCRAPFTMRGVCNRCWRWLG